MRATRSSDVAVIGAGVLGCLIAREILVAAPGASVTVLDRDLVAGGATRRSAGLHFPRGTTPVVRAMASESQRYYSELAVKYPELPIHQLPMTVVAPESAEPRLREVYLPEANLRHLDDVPQVVARLPEGMGAWSGDGCQYADVPALTQALAAELRPSVEFREGVTVTGLDTDGDQVRLTLGTGDTLTAARVVLATGPWIADPAWRHLVEPLGARVKKVVALHVEQPPSDADGVVVFQDEDAFLLPYRYRGHWLFSYTCLEWDVDPDTVPSGLSTANRAQAREVLGHYAPQLVDHCVSGRVFCDAYSPDGAPLVRPLTDDKRLVFAGAASGSGYRLAPAIAAEAVRLLSAQPFSR
ncbi:MAG: FAD-binding oxidoreductase [Streptomycetaceae bacterium]|nr:FAD-binding oxidoreductase [Streptomycetaceae bacterium]